MTNANAENLLAGLVETLRMGVQFGISATPEDLAALEKCAFDTCKTDLTATAKQSALEAAKREETPEEFERSYAANTVNITDASVRKSARFVAFSHELANTKQTLQAQLEQRNNESNADGDATNNSSNNNQSTGDGDDGDDGDVQDLDASDRQNATVNDLPISDIDPITKQPLENPCRNSVCGHVYGMNSVVEALQTNPRMRCPIMGCANKRPVRVADLKADKELARKLYVQRAQRKR